MQELKIKKLYLFIGIIVILVLTILFIAPKFRGNIIKENQNNFGSGIGLNLAQIAPDFTLQDPEKGVITKNTFNGKPLFIFFTTTWCVPCQIGAQNLVKYDDETGGTAFNALIVFVDEREKDYQILDWKNKFGNNDWYVAKGIEMAQDYQVQYLDTKYVFDKNGVIKWVDTKPLEYSTTKKILDPLL